MLRRRPASSTSGSFDLVPMPNQELELVLRDPATGGQIALGVFATLRDLEVLGSAGLHYAEKYANEQRPPYQVANRRARARRLGQALWVAAVERCGIEEPRGT
jgi:hypothetical protein